MKNKDLFYEFADTNEYKAWKESVQSLIEYLKDNEPDESELIQIIMADHIDSSLKLSKALKKAKNRVE